MLSRIKISPIFISTLKPTIILDTYSMKIVTTDNVDNTPTTEINCILFFKKFNKDTLT